MQVMNNSHPSEVKQIFAITHITSPISLPLTDMGQTMFNRNPFSQFGAP